MRRPVPPRIPGVRGPAARGIPADAAVGSPATAARSRGNAGARRTADGTARAASGSGHAAVPAARTTGRRGRRISRRVAAAGIGAVALVPLGGIVAAALNGTSRAPDAAPSTGRAPSAAPAASSPMPAPDPPMFSDVGASHPARDAVEWAAGAGVLPGREDGTFGPDETMSRGGFALALHRYAGAPETATDSPVFTDLPGDAALAAALQWAGARGILWGDGDMAVRAGAAITRSDLAAALMAAFAGGLAATGRAVQPADSTPFSDVDDAAASTLPLRWAAAAGALERSTVAADGTALADATGPGENLLVPQRGTTRAELAVALHAMQELLRS